MKSTDKPPKKPANPKVKRIPRKTTAGRSGTRGDEQLREVMETLAYHLDHSPLAVIEWGPDFRLVRWSGAAERVFGWKAEEVLGKAMDEFRWIHEEDAAQVAEVALDLRSGSNPHHFSANRNYCKDGRIIHCEWYNSALLDKAGNLRSILSLVLDVTERNETEQALREAERKYRELVRHAPAGIYEIDYRTKHFVSVNDAMCQFTGYTREELLAMNALDLLNAPSQALFKSRIAQWLQGEPPNSQVEYRIRTKDGSEADVILRATLTTDTEGKPLGATIVAHDITERKRAEAALRSSEQRYRALFDTTSDGVWLHDLTGTILQVNDAYCRMSGYTRRELEGMPISKLEALESATEIAGHINSVTTTGHDRFESRHRRKDGSAFDVDITAVYLQTESRIAIFVRDITERKQAEARLQADFTALSRIHDLSGKLLGQAGLQPLLQEIVDAAVEIAEADRGTLRLLENGSLRMVAQHGHDPEFLEFFGSHEGHISIGTEVAKRRERIVVSDLESSSLFAGTPTLEEFRRAGVRAAQSTPLISRGGTLLGVLTTHWRSPHCPDERALWRIDLLARQAADLIEQTRAERALRESEQRLRDAQQIANVGHWEWNIQSGAIVWSEQVYRQLGEEPDSFKPSYEGFVQRIHPQDRPAYQVAIERALAGEAPLHIELRVFRADGTICILDSRGKVILDAAGRPSRMLGACVDVTQRKAAEEALRQTELQFRTLADSIPNLAWSADAEGSTTWYNRRWYEYTGTTPAEMQGWGWQKVHDAKVLPEVVERWRASVASGTPFEMEFPLRGADGKFRWFLTRVLPLKGDTGKVLRWFGTNTDVSETREAREVLLRSKQELEALVAERTSKLQELVGELEHFSYSIVHDMRAPLRAMRGFAEIVEQHFGDTEKANVKDLLQRIRVAAHRMDNLITDALNYNQAVREELPLGVVDVAALLNGMLETYPELQPAKAHIRLKGDFPPVLANQAGLTQCFSNFLGNAVKFVRPGTIPDICIWAERRDPWVRFWVSDNGIGINSELLPRVFDMFSRGHRDYEGTGIGLALVRKVTQRMGGRVGVESEEGSGSRFWLELQSA